MKTNRIALVLFAFLLTFSTAQARKVLLRMNLQKGSTYEMNMNSTSNIDQEMMGQNMKIVQKMDLASLYKVSDILPNKNFRIEYSVLKMKMDMDINGNQMTFDSQNPDDSNPMGSLMKTIVAAKINFDLSPTGKVENVSGLDELSKQISGNRQMAQSMQMFANQENFGSFISQTFSYIPEKVIKKGEKWSSSFKLPSLMDANTVMNFEAASIEKNALNLNVNSDVNMESPIEQNGMKIDMKMTGTQTGTMVVDPEDGWVRASDLNQKFDMHMKMKNPQSGEDMEIPMTVNAVTKYTVEKK